MRSVPSPSEICARPEEMSKARSAASGVGKTYVELRNTAGRAEPTDRLGSKPCVSTLVVGRNGCDSRRSPGLLGLMAESPLHLYSTEPESAARAEEIGCGDPLVPVTGRTWRDYLF